MFTQDNNVYFEYFPKHYFVKSQESNEILLHVRITPDGLTQFSSLKFMLSNVPLCSTNPCINAIVSNNCTTRSTYTCHLRFRNPNIKSLCIALQDCNIPSNNKVLCPLFCFCMGKTHKLPSQEPLIVYKSP